MKSIIITGEQSSGKTTLVREITRGYQRVYETLIDNPISEIPVGAEVIVLDGLTTKDLPAWKQLISRQQLTFRPPYSMNTISISPLIIGIFQEYLDEFKDARHSIVFNLKRNK